ncbi:TetR/AcrR family transcriptional regulator [Nigerium massiliense]|uniref:TetR/AcrR family transcriptional regulator n=1 Tax=Nigerium massiliense TaxID=1522317 RepID=UPI0006932A27|nr:TetR family transcriptional regulator C-terminal domain-containing protein [Nigerium massiliense]
MPKVVDHEQRRGELAAAVLTIAVREGAEAVSLRKVAAEAGVAMGTVQHYFDDREHMLTYAFSWQSERRAARVQRALAELGERPSERNTLRTIFLEVLPLTDQSRFEALVGAAFYIRASHHAETRALMASGPQQVMGLLRGILAGARERGRLADGVDPAIEARVLWSLLEPASTVAGAWTRAEAVAMVDYHLDRILPPERQGAEDRASRP